MIETKKLKRLQIQQKEGGDKNGRELKYLQRDRSRQLGSPDLIRFA
jgi:hypothetical protein